MYFHPWKTDSARRRFEEEKREECEEERQAQVEEKGEDACNKLIKEFLRSDQLN